MIAPARLPALALALVAVLAAGGCSFLPQLGVQESSGFARSEVTVQALYASGDTGGVSEERISARPSDDGELAIDFSEDEVTGFGDMTRAASWNAVTVATLLSGAPLSTQYRFAFDGRIDGPSAGALTTVGVLSLYFGDEIDKTATMTGTINPTGTVGTVGGIPEKIQGVIDAGEITTVLIPAGQRNVPNAAGELVDVVQLGASSDVEVIEVATIYEAYQGLTGEELPSPEGSADPKVSESGYAKIQSATDATLARYDRSAAQYAALDASIRATGDTLYAEVVATADRARNLQVQGLQAGAFVEANEAAVTMQALANTFTTLQNILLQGFGALDTQLAGSATAEAAFEAFIDQLGTYEPESLTDVEALITSYGNAFDSYSLLTYATAELQRIFDTAAAGGYASIEQLLTDVFIPLIYYEFAQGNLDFAKGTFEIGRDNDGGPIADDADLAAIASFFRRGADANWAAFESGVIQPAAEARGESNDVFRTRLGSVDLGVALSYTAQQALPSLQDYIGEGEPNAEYAAMGYGVVNYARNAAHLEKYYNNGVLDESLTLVGVNSETILTSALDLGRSQVAKAVSVLKANGTDPVLTVGSFEQSGVDREGTVDDKFGAISGYTSSFVMTRIMAFVGGYPTEGYSR
ncbi:MAG: hypothetical protein RI885_2208 [Actinomycetota bacterium]